jgi:hypothetical protein
VVVLTAFAPVLIRIEQDDPWTHFTAAADA